MLIELSFSNYIPQVKLEVENEKVFIIYFYISIFLIAN